MYKRNMSYHSALTYVARRRMCVLLSGDLEHQLREYEPICRARRSAHALRESSGGESSFSSFNKMLAGSASRPAEPAPNQGFSGFQLELVEPLLDDGYAVWPLSKSSTTVGFTEGLLNFVHPPFVQVIRAARPSWF
jgi:hypothetical protein